MVVLDYRVKVSQVKRTPRPPKLSAQTEKALRLLHNPIPARYAPKVDEAELKYILSKFFNTPRPLLRELDKIDLDNMGREASRSIRVCPNPTTGQTLQSVLGWSDIEALLLQFDDFDTWLIATWVGRPIWAVSDITRTLKVKTMPDGSMSWVHNPDSFSQQEQEYRDEKIASFQKITQEQRERVFTELKRMIHPFLVSKPHKLKDSDNG